MCGRTTTSSSFAYYRFYFLLSYYKKKYEALVKRRGKKRAIIAIARRILTAVYQMLSTGEVWNPSDLYKIDMPAPLVEKQLSNKP